MANPKGSPQNLTPFKPGQSGNPGGKPVKARNVLSATLLRELSEDFDKHGKKAIQRVRTEDPTGYLRVIASFVPKEMMITREETVLDKLTDEELANLINSIEQFIGIVGHRSEDAAASPSGKPH